MAKTFLQIFEKYKADELVEEILNRAQNIKIQADKANRILQVSADFPMLIDKETLYRIETEIAKAYQLSWVKIMPHYPRELFNSSYIPDLLKETEKIGIVAMGFFNKYKYNLENNTLNIEIPFTENGVKLLYDGRTPGVMQGIILSEFGINIKVNISLVCKDIHFSFSLFVRR